MNFIRCLVFLLFIAAVSGCAKTDVPSPERETGPPVVLSPAEGPIAGEEVPQAEAEDLDREYIVDDPPKPYYVAQIDLPLYSEPRFMEPESVLPLNEKLLRYKIHRGFAFVKVLATGKTGWVDNAKLDWRKAMEPSMYETGQPDIEQEPLPTDNLLRSYPLDHQPDKVNQTSIEPNF